MRLAVDAGPLVAAAFRRDRYHESCASLLSEWPAQVIVPMLVVAEVGHLLGARIGPEAESAFARSLRDGDFEIEPVLASDWARIAELVDAYADLPLGITDASVVATCERLGIENLATLDRRDFGVVRPRHCPALRLLPEL